MALVALLVYVLFLLVVLFDPSGVIPNSGVSWLDRLVAKSGVPVTWASPGRVEFVCNAVIFVPAVVLGSLLWSPLDWRRWTGISLVVSVGVETVQALLLTQRSATLVDVVANTVGGLCGAVLSRAVSGWFTGHTARENVQRPA